jgi:predicted Na+-dependent transporter
MIALARGTILAVIPVLSRVRALAARYPELAAVLGAALLGLTARPPLAWLAAHQGISILLAILVFATAITIEPADLRRLAATWPSLLAAVAAGATVLPALSWAASRIAAAGPLRDGVLAVGLAPCEIASVATTAMAGGDAVLSAGVLIGSVLTSVAAAGFVLAMETGHARVDAGRIVVSLVLVVAAPLAAGLLLRARVPLPARAGRAAARTAVLAVAALVGVITAEVRLSVSYVPVFLALLAFLAGSALAGRLVAVITRAARPAAVALLLTTSMRDFAIAAGLAAAAFGPAAAAPLGLYGIVVLVWGTAAAGALRRRNGPAAAGPPDRPGGSGELPPVHDCCQGGHRRTVSPMVSGMSSSGDDAKAPGDMGEASRLEELGKLPASRQERDRVVGLLRMAASDGRLTDTELDARLEVALAAHTYAELAMLTADLPPKNATPAGPTPQPPEPQAPGPQAAGPQAEGPQAEGPQAAGPQAGDPGGTAGSAGAAAGEPPAADHAGRLRRWLTRRRGAGPGRGR